MAAPFEAAGAFPVIQADLPPEGWERLLEELGEGADSRVNPDGGAGGLGHAAGADGARMAVSLAHAVGPGRAESGLALAGDPYGGICALALRAAGGPTS